jgi:hypothetical protein
MILNVFAARAYLRTNNFPKPIINKYEIGFCMIFLDKFDWFINIADESGLLCNTIHLYIKNAAYPFIPIQTKYPVKMIKKICAALLLVSVSLQTFAWGQNGHRIIGAIAGSYLTKKAERNILHILGTESIAIASTWADFVKSDSSMNFLSPWHYININAGLNQAEFDTFLQQDKSVDAFTKINFLIEALKNKGLAADKKRFYLRLLIHIYGDIHQPMHVSRAEDQGGNKIKVLWFNEATNLHSVWDEKLIEQQKLSYSEYAKSINFTKKKQRRQWQQQSLSACFFESYSLAEKIYSGITQPDQKLGYRYNFDNIEMLNLQLLKGGVRLAGLLNTIFG